MGNYNLSGRSQYDLVGIYKYGIKHFGAEQAANYLFELESFLEELAERPELAKDSSNIAHSLKYYKYRFHVIFYLFESEKEIYIVRILGKRMNFVEHL